jgi:hypothetical protein
MKLFIFAVYEVMLWGMGQLPSDADQSAWQPSWPHCVMAFAASAVVPSSGW